MKVLDFGISKLVEQPNESTAPSHASTDRTYTSKPIIGRVAENSTSIGWESSGDTISVTRPTDAKPQTSSLRRERKEKTVIRPPSSTKAASTEEGVKQSLIHRALSSIIRRARDDSTQERGLTREHSSAADLDTRRDPFRVTRITSPEKKDLSREGQNSTTADSGAMSTMSAVERSFIGHVRDSAALATILPRHRDITILSASRKSASNSTYEGINSADTAHQVDQRTPVTGVGTPAFVSPEQWEDASRVDARTDIYALGCTLFYLLTSENVPEGNSSEILENKKAGKTRNPSELRDDVPPGLDRIAKRMTSVDPADRYESMDRVKFALEEVGAQPRVFISYRREDSLDATDRLYTSLKTYFDKESLFLDVHSIPAGVDFRDHIKSGVMACDVQLVIIGDYWLQPQNGEGLRRIDDPADFVRIEIHSALEEGLPVIPVLVGQARMPKARDLPSDIEALAFKNAAEVRAGSDYDAYVGRLVQDILAMWKAR